VIDFIQYEVVVVDGIEICHPRVKGCFAVDGVFLAPSLIHETPATSHVISTKMPVEIKYGIRFAPAYQWK